MSISGSVLAMTDTISESNLNRIGFKSSADLLLPTSVKGLKTLFALSVHRPMWFPNRLFKDYLEVRTYTILKILHMGLFFSFGRKKNHSHLVNNIYCKC